MKIAPLWHAIHRSALPCKTQIVHTGQHYDVEMSDVFLRQFDLPKPDHMLSVGSGSHAEQTAAVMSAYEQTCLDARPDWVIVVGDVNSTMAATLVAKKLLIPVVHLEAGLRSFDHAMPEEINRLITDSLADVLWTPSFDAGDNLRLEGVPEGKIECIGNVMIDSFEMLRQRIEARRASNERGLRDGGYAVVTLHRPSNVDNANHLKQLVDGLIETAARLPVVFPVHPRTRQRLKASGLHAQLESNPRIKLEGALDYIEFMSLVCSARMVVTDSGGVQEETTYLGIPCVTLRENTERPVTITKGSNRLVRVPDLVGMVDAILKESVRMDRRPELWDGHAADRAVASLRRHMGV